MTFFNSLITAYLAVAFQVQQEEIPWNTGIKTKRKERFLQEKDEQEESNMGEEVMITEWIKLLFNIRHVNTSLCSKKYKQEMWLDVMWL